MMAITNPGWPLVARNTYSARSALIVYSLETLQHLAKTSLYFSLVRNKEMSGDPGSEEGTRETR